MEALRILLITYERRANNKCSAKLERKHTFLRSLAMQYFSN